MAEANIPIKVQLDVKGAVVAYKGDKLLLVAKRHADTDAEKAHVQETSQFLSDFLDIEVLIVDGIENTIVVRNAEKQEIIAVPNSGRSFAEKMAEAVATLTPEAAPDHDFNMPHSMDATSGSTQCPPNCPANPVTQLIQREPQTTMQDQHPDEDDRFTATYMTRTPGMNLATEVGLPDPRGPKSRAEAERMGHINLICRRCYRRAGDTVRTACGDCPDFAETLEITPQVVEKANAMLAEVGLPPLPPVGEIFNQIDEAREERRNLAAPGGPADFPPPPGYVPPVKEQFPTPSYYDIPDPVVGTNSEVRKEGSNEETQLPTSSPLPYGS